MLWVFLASDSAYVQPSKDRPSGGGDFVPFSIYSPPSGVIRVTTSDAQIYQFQYPPGTEHYRLGCYCNGWGIGYGSGSYYQYTNYDNSLYGVSLISSYTVSWGPIYRWRVIYRTNDYRFRIQHDFAYCTTNGALHVTTTILNTSGTTQYGVKFKRYIDWDMTPGYFSNNHFGRTSTMCYASSSDYNRYAALAALSPTPNVIELYGWDHYNTYTSSFDYSSYTGDGYCLLDWYFGTMYSGNRRIVDYCYAAASSYGSLTSTVYLCNTCPTGEDEGLSVEEMKPVEPPEISAVPGGVMVKHYTGELKIFSLDGRLVKNLKRYNGGTIPLHPGTYIVKLPFLTRAVVVR